MTGHPSLRWLQGWAYRQWTLESPNLQHSVELVDKGGGPKMKGAAAAYLGLAGRGHPAFRVDEDGRYVTPLRAALVRVRDPWLRLFLRDLVPEQLNPSLICRRHGIPAPVEVWVMHAALEYLWNGYEFLLREQRYRDIGWVDQSDSQRNAVLAGEAVA